MGTLYSGTASTREGLEAWLGFALEAYRFLDRHLEKGYRPYLSHFARFVSRGEVFITFRAGKIAGVAIIGVCEPDQVANPVDDIIRAWGTGVVLYCPVSVVLPKYRPGGAKLLDEMLMSARERFPEARFLAFRRVKTGSKVHVWELRDPGEVSAPDYQQETPEEEGPQAHGEA